MERLMQNEVVERFSISQRVISRLWRRFTETGSLAEQDLGSGRCKTAIQDRYLILIARRQPLLRTPTVDGGNGVTAST